MNRLCYFCQAECQDNNGISHWCHICRSTYDLGDVITSYSKDKIVMAHLYFDRYHIRLEFDRRVTVVTHLDLGISGTIIPGIFFTPENVKKKFKLYMLFS